MTTSPRLAPRTQTGRCLDSSQTWQCGTPSSTLPPMLTATQGRVRGRKLAGASMRGSVRSQLTGAVTSTIVASAQASTQPSSAPDGLRAETGPHQGQCHVPHQLKGSATDLLDTVLVNLNDNILGRMSCGYD